VKTRQQPPEAWAGTRTSVTPAGAGLGLGEGASRSTADDVQAWIETNITKQGNADRRDPFRPVNPRLAASGLVCLPQHADEHRPEYPVLLAVDRQLGECPALGWLQNSPIRVGPLEVGEHEDM
jgi:hypothetical protein